MFEVKKYEMENIGNDSNLRNKIALLIKETFEEIQIIYEENDEFKKEVLGDLEDTVQKLDNTNVFYVIENAEQKIIACLRGTRKEMYLNPEMGEGNAFYSKYIGIDEKYRRQGLGNLLKQTFEQEAENKHQENKKPSMVISRVHKENIASRTRNQSREYQERPDTDQNYLQYYKIFDTEK